MSVRKVHFLGRDLLFLPSFLNETSQNDEEGTVLSYLDSSHSNTPMNTYSFSLSEKRIFESEKHCTHIVSVMWLSTSVKLENFSY